MTPFRDYRGIQVSFKDWILSWVEVIGMCTIGKAPRTTIFIVDKLEKLLKK